MKYGLDFSRKLWREGGDIPRRRMSISKSTEKGGCRELLASMPCPDQAHRKAETD